METPFLIVFSPKKRCPFQFVRVIALVDGDGVGDVAGVTRQLGYLQWLGVDAIWLSPIHPSPMADYGYDVSDYRDVDPVFGDLKTLEALGFCMAVLRSAAGRPGRYIKPSSTPSTSLRKTYRLNQLRYDLRKLKGHSWSRRRRDEPAFFTSSVAASAASSACASAISGISGVGAKPSSAGVRMAWASAGRAVD